MTYTPKVGDRVTVTGDDREWVVSDEWLDMDNTHKWVGSVEVRTAIDGRRTLRILPSMLTPVPTPPPEPPKFVRHAGHLYTDMGVAHDAVTRPPRLIDPANPNQVRDAGLCRVDEVLDESWWFDVLPDVLCDEHCGRACNTRARRAYENFRERFGGDA